MSTQQTSMTWKQNVTPPSSLSKSPWTPPPTDEKQFAQAHQVVSLFHEIRVGRHIEQGSWAEFRLTKGEYDEIRRLLQRDNLLGYVKDKIRHDYNAETKLLVIRMPTGVHELFIDGVEDAIRSQLKVIRNESGPEARYAQKVRPGRSTEIEFPAEEAPSGRKSRYEPDASFWHDDAEYPGVVIEVAYSQNRKRLYRLAESYLLDSDASVQVVVGLDIEYSKRGSAVLQFLRQHIDRFLRSADERGFRPAKRRHGLPIPESTNKRKPDICLVYFSWLLRVDYPYRRVDRIHYSSKGHSSLYVLDPWFGLE